jgi:hypothetical protein
MPAPEEFTPSDPSSHFIELRIGAIHRAAMAVALTSMLVVLWCLTHRYLGIAGDAKLYAIQALARIHPELAHDLFLQNGGQDRFTVFSPFYAWCIGLFGLHNAEMALTLVFKVWLFAAAWLLARNLFSGYIAFLATAALIITASGYGGYDVFHYAEDWLTARSLAEALVITALAANFLGFRVLGMLIAVGALFVHPLMALPGILVLMCLWAPIRMNILGVVAGILAALGIAFAAVTLPSAAHVFTVLDAGWLEIALARSQHLFLQLWSADDWRLNARPFISLTISALALNDPRVRKLCIAVMLIGATGLAVAMIASLVGPVAILLQGQAWRWSWLTAFVAVILLVPTALIVWRDDRCGPLCTILLVSGWTFTAVDGPLFTTLALALWTIRNRITPRIARHLRWAAIAVAAMFVAWVVANSWTIGSSNPSESGREPPLITLVRDVMGLDVLPLVIVGALAYRIRITKSVVVLTAICVALLASCALVVPGALTDVGQVGASAAVTEFTDWRRAIPPGSNVFVVPLPMSASFAWFTLGRPSYLSADQSSGVVFSRDTALEVRRRAAVVQALWYTNWHLVSRKHTPRGHAPILSSDALPLTREILVRICRDPDLNFVVAKEKVGFDPLPHTHNGGWKDWSLYDCRRVNSVNPPA